MERVYDLENLRDDLDVGVGAVWQRVEPVSECLAAMVVQKVLLYGDAPQLFRHLAELE